MRLRFCLRLRYGSCPPSSIATFPQAMASAEATTCATHFIASWIELATPFDGRWVPTFSKTTRHAPVRLTIIWTWHGLPLPKQAGETAKVSLVIRARNESQDIHFEHRRICLVHSISASASVYPLAVSDASSDRRAICSTSSFLLLNVFVDGDLECCHPLLTVRETFAISKAS